MDAPKDLNEKVADLLADDLAENGGGFVTGFYLIAEHVDGEGQDGWLYATPGNQTMSRTTGLIEWARGVARYEQRRHLEDIAED